MGDLPFLQIPNVNRCAERAVSNLVPTVCTLFQKFEKCWSWCSGRAQELPQCCYLWLMLLTENILIWCCFGMTPTQSNTFTSAQRQWIEDASFSLAFNALARYSKEWTKVCIKPGDAVLMPEEAWFLTQSEFVYFLMSVLVFHNQSCAPCFFLYGAPVPLLAQNGSFLSHYLAALFNEYLDCALFAVCYSNMTCEITLFTSLRTFLYWLSLCYLIFHRDWFVVVVNILVNKENNILGLYSPIWGSLRCDRSTECHLTSQAVFAFCLVIVTLFL